MTLAATLYDQPHHDGSALYVAEQAPALDQRVQVWVCVPAGSDVRAVHARSVPDGAEVFTAAVVDEGRTGAAGPAVAGLGPDDTWWTTYVTVRNPVTRYRFLLTTPTGTTWLTATGVSGDDVTDSTDFRLVAHRPSADWSARAVVYEMFPDRFARSAPTAPTAADAPGWAVPCAWEDAVVDHGPLGPRQLFGGDLDGVVAHLDHLQTLGVDTLYLRPVFPAASNHRYDASTFDEVDELVGGRPALDRLARAVHDRGMRLVGDLTTNHCGDTHEWFRAATPTRPSGRCSTSTPTVATRRGAASRPCPS
ncbi:alpha-amylase family glycosyl hydrolase [Cellulomonas hominis]